MNENNITFTHHDPIDEIRETIRSLNEAAKEGRIRFRLEETEEEDGSVSIGISIIERKRKKGRT